MGKEPPCASRRYPSTPAAARRNDKWIVIGPGGGGAQFFPAVSPHDPRKVYVASDMSQGFTSEDGGESWRMFNIRGAIRFFVFDPVADGVAYARSATALLRTTDDGATWELVHPAPDNVERIVSLEDHAWQKIITKDGSRELVEALSVDPSDSNTLYASMVCDDRSVFTVSRDRGSSWERLADLPAGGKGIHVDPRSLAGDRTVYVAGLDAVRVFENGAWSHRRAPEGVTAFNAVSVSFATDGPPAIYAASGKSLWHKSETIAGVFVSRDGARSWTRCDGDIARQFEGVDGVLNYTTVTAAPSDGRITYASYRVDPTGGGLPLFMGVAKTTDGGASCQLVWRDSTTTPGPGMQDAWMNERFSPEWGENPFCIDVAPTDPDVVYATDFGRTLRTTDGGKTWVGVYSKRTPNGKWTTTGLDMTTCYGVHFDPFEPNRVWIDYTDIGAFVSDDGGTTWKSGTGDSPHQSFRETEAAAPTDRGAASGPGRSSGVPRPWVNTTYWMQFDPAVKGCVWAVMSGIHDLPFAKMWKNLAVSKYNGGVCRSDDGGRTWRPSNKGMPETACTHIILDPNSPVDARVLYVTGFGTGVWKSTDGGASWNLRNNGLRAEEPFAWRLTLDDEGKLYLVVARRSYDGSYGTDQDGRLYRSVDGAETWQEIPLPEGVNGPMGLSVDPRDSKRLYLATWGRYDPLGDRDGGIWLSTDGGGSWRRIFDAQEYIYDVTIDPRNPDILYSGSMLFSVWRSADAGATWRRLKGYNFKQAKRVILDPFDPDRIFVTTFGGSVWYGPAEGDPDAVEDIVTPVVAYDR